MQKNEDSYPNIWCVIPVYNNSATIKDIALECHEHLKNVLVVDDGSTDANVSEILNDTDITILTHKENKGKGAAIITALEYIHRLDGTYMITIDGDGQHAPADISKFLPEIKQHKNAIIIGCRDFSSENVPGSSKFGRGFSNMWVRIETGLSLKDTQSGFRAYPVRHLIDLDLTGHRYDFEIEVLARAAWAGLDIRDVDIGVRYHEDRVSSFHPFKSNLEISLMHTRLIGRRLVPWPHRQLAHHRRKTIWTQLKSPGTFIQTLLKENAEPAGLAAAAAVGTALAVLPIMGFHTISIIYVTARLHLNKVMAVTIQNLYAPPFVPFLCVELGHYIRHGKWWTELSWHYVTGNLHNLLFEWLIGSLLLAPIFALLAWVVVYSVASSFVNRKGEKKSDSSAKKRGNALSLWFFKASLRVFGLRGAYGLLYPVCFHYLIFDRSAVRAAMAYVSRRYPDSGFIARHHHVLMLFISQGKQLIDRSAALSGQIDFEFNIKGEDHARELVDNAENGLILLTSHMGNWQLAISSLTHLNKDVYLVMLPEHNESLKKALKMRKDNDHIKIISPEAHLGGVVEIMNVLRAGNIVSIMGDRAYGFESIDVDFLGDKARFPYGAFKIAAATGCPILFLLSEKTATKSYAVDISQSIQPSYTDRKSRKTDLSGWVQDYARMLQKYTDRNPRQCFLFHDVWEKKNIE